MSRLLGPDWRKLAESQRIELSDTAFERLEVLSKALLPLRGLIDWKEEPATIFKIESAEEEPK